jgi:DNA-binding MarR family transcriptional regulator
MPTRAKYVDDEEKAALDRARNANTARMLLRCARLVSERAIDDVRTRTGEQRLRNSHTTLLLNMELEGIRLTELARRLGVSKQTTAELVDDLEQMRVLERVKDPDDGRAKLIRFARRKSGRLALFDVLAVLAEVEAKLASTLDADDLAALRRGLQALTAALEPEAAQGA